MLCSGGLDSTTCMAIAASRGFELVAVSFDYGQRHHVELAAARRVAEHYGVRRHIVVEDRLFRAIGGSALTDEIEVPRPEAEGPASGGIPVTYVPARNLVFLSQAVAIAEVLGSEDVFIGVNAVDYSGYPDCRPEFIESFERTARLATKAGVEGTARVHVHAPLIAMSKADIVRAGTALDAPYALTHSCYAPDDDGRACGACESCRLRRRGFVDAGVPDPTRYVSGH